MPQQHMAHRAAPFVLGLAPAAGMYNRVDCDDINNVRRLLLAALQLGILEWDTAPWYGTGRSEWDVGEVLDSIEETEWARLTQQPQQQQHQQQQQQEGGGGRLRLTTKVGRVIIAATSHGTAAAADPRVEPTAHGFTPFVPRDADRFAKEPLFDRFARDSSQSSIPPPVRSSREGPPLLLCRHDYTSIGVAKSLEQSMRRLGRRGATSLTCLRLHDADTDERIAEALQVPGGGIEELRRLKMSGKIAEIGTGLNDPVATMRLLDGSRESTFDSVLLAGSFNLMDQTGLPVLRQCRPGGRHPTVAFHNAGIFGSGYLVGGNHLRYAPVVGGKGQGGGAESPAEQRRSELMRIASEHGVTLPEMAIYFAATPAAVRKTVIGCATERELREVHAMYIRVALDPGTRVRAHRAVLQCIGRSLVDPQVADCFVRAKL